MSLRLGPSVALRERRLTRLLQERGIGRDDPRLVRVVEDALAVGSLELAGIRISWEEARAAGGGPPALAALRRARAAVAAHEPVSLGALRSWHAALAGPAGFRRADVETAAEARSDASAAQGARAGAPAAFIEDRLASLAEWLDAGGSASLSPEQKAAVALARVVEIRPFDDANGRVSRLVAGHLLERAGLAPPILAAGDAPRLQAALASAFALETGPLVELVREASGRTLDVMIQSLERGLV